MSSVFIAKEIGKIEKTMIGIFDGNARASDGDNDDDSGRGGGFDCGYYNCVWHRNFDINQRNMNGGVILTNS